ncbi:hypothetical protein CUMW_143360 [Citrus unshiu]|nr:hypothetical protein CUMW_143360 [Citrus unshiu]
MSLRFCNSHSLYHLLLVLVIFCSISAIYAKANEDATIRTMEAFSGYPIHESNSFVTNLASSLSVDTETLQKRIDELSTFSDTPAPSVTRVLYTENDVLARSYIKNLMGLSGLSVREDAVGNIFGTSIGIVTAIAAPASIKVDFEGNGGHAGAVLMPNRNDAGLAASELALAVEKHVLESGSIDTVGTVGILELHPGAINSIPSKSHLEIDTRDIDEKRRNSVIEKIRQSAIIIAKNRGVTLSEFKIVNQDPPALSEKSIIEAVEAASKELNLTHKLMISRAYHDSLFMARVSPMGMIFIPCFKGYSHKPEEYASGHDMENGVKVLALTLAKLSLQ